MDGSSNFQNLFSFVFVFIKLLFSTNVQSIILRKGAKKMDGRSWPWKRKSSDKATTEKLVVGNESTTVCSLSYLASLENQVLLFISDLCFYMRLLNKWLSSAYVSVLVRL